LTTCILFAQFSLLPSAIIMSTPIARAVRLVGSAYSMGKVGYRAAFSVQNFPKFLATWSASSFCAGFLFMERCRQVDVSQRATSPILSTRRVYLTFILDSQQSREIEDYVAEYHRRENEPHLFRGDEFKTTMKL
jgi:hypothetical protein